MMLRTIRCISMVFFGAMLLPAVAASGADAPWPCVGRPAIVAPGGQFGLGDIVEGTVFLLADGTRTAVSVLPNEAAMLEGVGIGSIPESVPPGRYDLVVTGADGESVRPGAVHIVAPDFGNYSIALVRADGVGAVTPDGRMFSDGLMEKLALTAADLVFVVGTLTRDGSVTGYESVRRRFSDIAAPVVFCPDRAELLRGAYRELFGNAVYPIRFGADGFLLLGAGIAHVDSGNAALNGSVYRHRRDLRACRWSVGVAGRFGLDWSVRSQLTLFVDDPLDYLIVGEVPEAMGEKVPWGRTRFVGWESGSADPLQLIVVGESGMRPRGDG